MEERYKPGARTSLAHDTPPRVTQRDDKMRVSIGWIQVHLLEPSLSGSPGPYRQMKGERCANGASGRPKGYATGAKAGECIT